MSTRTRLAVRWLVRLPFTTFGPIRQPLEPVAPKGSHHRSPADERRSRSLPGQTAEAARAIMQLVHDVSPKRLDPFHDHDPACAQTSRRSFCAKATGGAIDMPAPDTLTRRRERIAGIH